MGGIGRWAESGWRNDVFEGSPLRGKLKDVGDIDDTGEIVDVGDNVVGDVVW
jgi:hypothetical protein